MCMRKLPVAFQSQFEHSRSPNHAAILDGARHVSWSQIKKDGIQIGKYRLNAAPDCNNAVFVNVVVEQGSKMVLEQSCIKNRSFHPLRNWSASLCQRVSISSR